MMSHIGNINTCNYSAAFCALRQTFEILSLKDCTRLATQQDISLSLAQMALKFATRRQNGVKATLNGGLCLKNMGTLGSDPHEPVEGVVALFQCFLAEAQQQETCPPSQSRPPSHIPNLILNSHHSPTSEVEGRLCKCCSGLAVSSPCATL